MDQKDITKAVMNGMAVSNGVNVLILLIKYPVGELQDLPLILLIALDFLLFSALVFPLWYLSLLRFFNPGTKQPALVLYLPFIITALFLIENFIQMEFGNRTEMALRFFKRFPIKLWHRQCVVTIVVFVLCYRLDRASKQPSLGGKQLSGQNTGAHD